MTHQLSREYAAFVLMPFAAEFDRIYTDLIKLPLESEGFFVTRADSLSNQQSILKDIIHGIVRANLVVAEVTVQNPNVYYELGIAHALLKPTVMLAQTLDQIPFDLRSYKIIKYATQFTDVGQLSSAIQEVARHLKSGSIAFGNPVSDFAPTVAQGVHQITYAVTSGEFPTEASEPLTDEAGWIDHQLDVTQAYSEIDIRTTRVIGAVERVSQLIAGSEAELKTLEGTSSPGTTQQVSRIFDQLATGILSSAGEIEAEIPEIHRNWEKVLNGTLPLMAGPIDLGPDAIDNDRTINDGNLAVVRQNLEAVTEMRASLGSMQGLAQGLNRAVRRLDTSLERLCDEFRASESILVRLQSLFVERLPTSEASQCGQPRVKSRPRNPEASALAMFVMTFNAYCFGNVAWST